MYHIGVCYEPDVEQLNAQRYKAQRCGLLIIGRRHCFHQEIGNFQMLSDFQFKLYAPVCLIKREGLGEVLLGPKEIRINVIGYVIVSNQTTANKQTKSCCFVSNVI